MTNEKHPLAGGSPTVPRGRGSFRFALSWLTRVNLFFLLCAIAHAQTSGTFSGGMGLSGTWEITGTNLRAIGQFTSDYNGDQVAFDLGMGGGVSGPQATGPGQVKNFDLTVSIGSDTLGEGRLRIFSTNNGTVATYVRASATWEWNTAPPQYEVKVQIPMNTEPTRAIYFAMQNGVQVDFLDVEHAAGPLEWVIGPLDTDDPVIVVRYAGGDIYTDGEGGWVKAPNGSYVPVTPNMTPVPVGTSEAVDANQQPTSNPSQPQNVTPATPQSPTSPPTAPTATTSPTAPARSFPVPFGAPSATPATSGDAGADQVTTALNAQTAQDYTIGMDIIESLETQTLSAIELGEAAVTATDKVSAQVQAVGEKQIEATDKVATAVSETADKQLEATNESNVQLGIIAGQAQKESAEPGVGDIEAQKESKLETINTLADDARTTAQAVALQTPEVATIRSDQDDADSDEWNVAIPGTDIVVNINPLAQPKAQFLAELMRLLMGWAVVLALVAWTYIQIPKWHVTALQGGSGISVWKSITGATPLVGVAILAALWAGAGALVLTSPTLLWAASDPFLMGQKAFAFVDVRGMVEIAATNTGETSTTAARIIAMIDACCPVGLLLQAFFNWVFLSVTGESIVAGVIALQKVLASG